MELHNTSKQSGRRLALDITLRRNSPKNHHPHYTPPHETMQNLNTNTHSFQPSDNRSDLSINVSLPAMSRFGHFVSSKKIVIIAVAVIIAGSFVGASIVRSYKAEKTPVNTTSSNRPVGNPEYQTVLPDGKSIDELGDWKRVSPPDGDPVFAYLDKIDGISVSVSQQPMPRSLKGSTAEQIAELAKKFSATSRIDADGTKVYIGTSAKGPQSAILTKSNLLILIKSQEKINDTSWAKYAKSLN